MHLYTPSIVTDNSTAADADDDWTRRNGWFDIVDFASKWGLEIAVTPWSWYSPFSTVNIVLHPPEWYRSNRD